MACYTCKEIGNYANESNADETMKTLNKKGSNFLVLKNDGYKSSSDKENNNYIKDSNSLDIITESNNEEE